MILRIHTPNSPLNQFVDNLVYFEGFNPEHRIDRFLPDGNTEIVIDFHDTPQYIYDNETLKEKIETLRTHAAHFSHDCSDGQGSTQLGFS